ncbi:MAG: hypothetical protein AAB262_14010, partial [Elusimicrobiota bacterium]
LDRFLTYYGNLELRRPDGVATSADAVFETSPSLVTYREHVLRDARKYLVIPRLEDIVHRRVGGDQSISKIVDSCREAPEHGFRPLMIIDEPQFGASDRLVEGDAGLEVRKCVLAQIFDSIEKALGSTPDDHWFVGLSATPFEMNDVSRFWEVRQSLTETYSGFNYFNGEAISPGVNVSPPTTMSLASYAEIIGVPFLASVSMAAYDKPKAFVSHAPRIGYRDGHDAYRTATEEALRGTVYAVIEKYRDDEEWPVGLCIRAFNDNAKTRALIDRLNLDPERIEVLPYYGTETSGVSVKRAVAARAHPELPYLILVTNRARMADAFPRQVRFFMDLAQKASDLNALLQGLLGRACGYSKRSTVVLSEANAVIVESYVATNGGYVHKTSRHTVTVGGYRRGAPTGMLRLRVEMEDPLVRKFFEHIDRDVVRDTIDDGPKMRVPRAKEGTVRRGPILRVAEELGLFDHIEQPANRVALFPTMPTGFHVVRPGEMTRPSRDGQSLGYSLDPAGNCRYTFRRSDRDKAAKGGGAGRAKGKKDSGADDHVEPTIYVEKYDPTTGVAYDLADQTTSGAWRAFMVTFPLRDAVRELRAAEVAYPVANSPYDHYMNDEERETRDGDTAE